MTTHYKRGRAGSYPWLSVSRIGRRPRSVTRADWLIVTVLILLGAVGLVLSRQREGVPQSFTTVGPGGDVRVSLADMATGEARFIQYLTLSGSEVRFFVVRSTDGVTRAALDACQPCYREGRGYRQVGSHMVCIYCRKSFHSAFIDQAADGCHPVPVERIIEGNALIVRASALEKGASFFQ